jgi:hypothetical protein
VREKGEKIADSAPHEKFNTGEYMVENRGGEITLFAKKTDEFKDELKEKAREVKAEARVNLLFQEEGVPFVTPEFKEELKERAIPDSGSIRPAGSSAFKSELQGKARETPNSAAFWEAQEEDRAARGRRDSREKKDWERVTEPSMPGVMMTPEFKEELREKAKLSKFVHENQGVLSTEFKEELKEKSREIRHEFREKEEMRHGLSDDFKKELKHVAHKKHRGNKRRDFTELERRHIESPLKEEHGEIKDKKHHHHQHKHHHKHHHHGHSGKKETIGYALERTA